uniref:Uncharacterized protein n=1 Tax=Leptobrachium leishanense TaxID=445787 RepID=A0A8C5LVI4_9ANUR
MFIKRFWIEPVVAGAQVASSFYDTSLLLVVKNHYNQSTFSSNISNDDEVQKAISNFYIRYNVIMGVTPLFSAYILARIGDRRGIKITICIPLIGYLISRLLLLFVILWEWPLEVMFGSAALNGLTGWFTTYWAGVMAWASQESCDSRRSLRLIITELVYGMAGFVGSLASGHIFISLTFGNRQGVILVSCSLACYVFCVFYSIFVLKTPDSIENHFQEDKNGSKSCAENDSHSVNSDCTEQTRLLGNPTATDEKDVTPSNVILVTMFTSAILFSVASIGSDDVINIFVLKNPLSWGPVEVGYGNAAAYVNYITSFLGVYVFSKCFGDFGLIVIGMLSFSAGILIMAFVQWTYLYYIARAVMMFSLIPLPTIRSRLSKHVQGSSYGQVFTILQLGIGIVVVSASAGFNKLYQSTLDWYSGFCFIVFSVIGFLSIIPIIIAACNQISAIQNRNTINEETVYGTRNRSFADIE